MTSKPSPVTAVAIQARLAQLRRRKSVLDEMILLLEKYEREASDTSCDFKLFKTQEESGEPKKFLVGAA
jgi:hypothetical protein